MNHAEKLHLTACRGKIQAIPAGGPHMDWSKIVQRRLMPIGELTDCLSFEFVREIQLSFDDIRAGKGSKTLQEMGRHSAAVLDLLGEGHLLGNVRVARGNSQALHTLCEIFRAISRIHERQRRIALYRGLDPELPPASNASAALWEYYLTEISSREQVRDLEVVPEEVLRWLNSIDEGQALLPEGLRAYLASLPSGQTLPQSGQPGAEPSPPADGKRTYIPRNLWAQKPLQQVCDDMRAAGFKDDAVAYALFHWRGVSNKTELGKLLRGGDLTDGAYYKYANKQLDSSLQWETDR